MLKLFANYDASHIVWQLKFDAKNEDMSKNQY